MPRDIFETLNIEPSFLTNKGVLKKKYYQISKSNHPDFFVLADKHAKEQAEKNISEAHRALKILSNLDLTIKYIVEKQNIDVNEKGALPQDFLFETMEINEQIEEYKNANNDSALEQIKKIIQQKEEELFRSIEPLLRDYNKTINDKVALIKLKEYYLKKQYFKRIRAIM